MKKVLAIMLSLTLLVSLLAGCGSSSSSQDTTAAPTSADGGNVTESVSETPETNVNPDVAQADFASIEGTTVKVGIKDDPGSLSPWAGNSMGRIAVCPSIYQCLFGRDYINGGIVGVIASDYEHIDGTHTKVTIKDNVHDSNGNNITASDVAFCYNTLHTLGNSRDINNMEVAEATGDYEVTFTWARDLSGTLGAFSNLMCDVYIVSQKEYEASPDEMSVDPVGTTGYKVESYVAGSQLVLKAYDDFWQKDAEDLIPQFFVNVETIDFQIIPEASQIAVALETGNIDMSTGVSTNDLYLFEEGGMDADDFSVFKRLDNKGYTAYFNCAEHLNTYNYGNTDGIDYEDYTSPTSNENLRKAIAYCFDANGILAGAFGGNGQIIKSCGGNQKYSDYDPAWDEEDYYDYDLDKAKEYLEKACQELGKDAKDITIQIQAGSDGAMTDVATVLQGYILELGLQCVINVNDDRSAGEDPTYWDIRVNSGGSTDYAVNTWGYRYSDASHNWPQDPQLNSSFCHDDTLDDLNTRVRSEKEFSQELANETRQYITDKCYAVGICVEFYNIVARNNITDVAMSERVCLIPGACVYDWN